MKRIMNFYRLAALLLPVNLRKPRILSIVKALMTPLYTVQRFFLLYREEVIYKINHNGQVCYLRGVLNDTFDNSERRIRIEDPYRNDFLILYQRPEMKQIDLGRELISRRDSVSAEQLDFVVKVPLTLKSVDNESRMRAVINFYKLAGKQYRIDYE